MKQKLFSIRRTSRSEKGSLALEQVLFIGAIVALSAGLYVFYGNLSDYFRNVGFSAPPSNVGAAATTTTN